MEKNKIIDEIIAIAFTSFAVFWFLFRMAWRDENTPPFLFQPVAVLFNALQLDFAKYPISFLVATCVFYGVILWGAMKLYRMAQNRRSSEQKDPSSTQV